MLFEIRTFLYNSSLSLKFRVDLVSCWKVIYIKKKLNLKPLPRLLIKHGVYQPLCNLVLSAKNTHTIIYVNKGCANAFISIFYCSAMKRVINPLIDTSQLLLLAITLGYVVVGLLKQ